MWFNHKKNLHSDEYEQLSKRIIALNEEVRILETKLKMFETNLDNLRGNINAKLLRRLKKEEEDDKEEESKTINNPVILPWNGSTK